MVGARLLLLSCKFFNASPPDLLFQRLLASPPSAGCWTFLITGKGGSIFSMLTETEFSLLSSILGPLAPFTITSLLLWAVLLAIDAVVPGRFLPEKILLSLEYLTLLLFLQVTVSLLEVGKPSILLFILTCPMQPISGDKGSVLEMDMDRYSHFGRVTSLMVAPEHNLGKNVLLCWRWRFWLWKWWLYPLPMIFLVAPLDPSFKPLQRQKEANRTRKFWRLWKGKGC